MCLAAANIRLLTLTARKSDIEYNISIDSMHKMALVREQSELSQTYYSKLQAKNIAYYANGRYNKINYQYLMGYGKNYAPILSGDRPLKTQNSMILTDYRGQVVLNQSYADAITAVLGASAINADGRGGTFSKEKIPEILEKLIPGHTAEEFQTVINDKKLSSEVNATNVNQLTGETTGSSTLNISDEATQKIQSIVDFYYPIFSAAAANGFTLEYNQELQINEDYVSDALVSGTFQLATVDISGNYDPDTSLTYFITAGLVEENTSSDIREEITAWYNHEKELVAEKEKWIDIDLQNLSTELEATKTEMEGLKKWIDDAIQNMGFATNG